MISTPNVLCLIPTPNALCLIPTPNILCLISTPNVLCISSGEEKAKEKKLHTSEMEFLRWLDVSRVNSCSGVSANLNYRQHRQVHFDVGADLQRLLRYYLPKPVLPKHFGG